MAILHAGIATFLQAPPVACEREALRELGANVGVLGLPYDSTTVTRPGASHGPRAVRDASSHFSFGGGYHLDYDVTLSDHLTLADCGDVDGAPGRAEETCDRTERALDEIYAEPLSHCCPAHRVLDLPNVDGRNMAIIGAHGAANPKLEKDVADEHGLTVFTVRDIDRIGIDEVARRALAAATE